MMVAYWNGKFKTEDPADKEQGTISLACFTPLSNTAQQKIAEQEAEYTANAQVGQVETNRKQMDTKLPKSYAHKLLADLLTTLRNYSAKMQLLSDLQLQDGMQPRAIMQRKNQWFCV